MKKLIYLAAAVVIAVSCTQEKSPELVLMEHIRDSLEMVNMDRDATINDFIGSLNEIEQNLETIKQKENIVTVAAEGGAENAQSQSEKINEDINLIYNLLLENQKKISRLKRKLSGSDIQIAELTKMVERLNQQLEEKNVAINLLKEQLGKMNVQIEVLNQNIDSLYTESAFKDEVISAKEDELNVAHYAFGSKKELMEHQVITKEGGFVGIGKIVKLMQDFNKDYFTKVDIREFKELSLNATKASLITTHPSTSYEFEGNGTIEKLVITDPNAFWGTSKYLVIMVE